MAHSIFIHEMDDSTNSTVRAFLDALKINFNSNDLHLSDDELFKTPKNKSWGLITDLGLHRGDTLRYKDDSDEFVTVRDDTHVDFGGMSISLSKATMNAKSNRDEDISHGGFSGRSYWTFDGETLLNRGRRLGLK